MLEKDISEIEGLIKVEHFRNSEIIKEGYFIDREFFSQTEKSRLSFTILFNLKYFFNSKIVYSIIKYIKIFEVEKFGENNDQEVRREQFF